MYERTAKFNSANLKVATMALGTWCNCFCHLHALSKDELCGTVSLPSALFAKETSFPHQEGGKESKYWGNASQEKSRDWHVGQSRWQVQWVHSRRKGANRQVSGYYWCVGMHALMYKCWLENQFAILKFANLWKKSKIMNPPNITPATIFIPYNICIPSSCLVHCLYLIPVFFGTVPTLLLPWNVLVLYGDGPGAPALYF